MKRALLLLFLTATFAVQSAQAQRKGLNFSKEAYQNIPLAEDETLGYTGEDLPTSVNYKAYAPYPGNQGDYGTCVGWSTAYGALSIEYAKQMGITDREQITFSAFCPYYIYNQFKEEYDFFCQSGGFFEDALEILYTKGAKRYYLPEYSCYSDYEDFPVSNASNFKIKDYYRLFDWNETEFDKALGLESDRVENIKKALSGGHPVLIGMYVPSSFDWINGDVWSPTQEEKENYNSQPGHAMTIVGYDDNKYGGAFEVMNSWGRTWGNDGFVWVKYEDMDIFGHTAFYMDLGYNYFPSSGCQLGDCANGYSRYKFDDTGDVYEGELKDGYWNGQGIYMWNNGEAYAGGWKDGFKHGKGIQMYASGTTMDGYWKDNVYYGSTEPEWEEEDKEVSDLINTDPEEQEEEEEEESTWDIDWSVFWDEVDEDEATDDVVDENTGATTGCISGDCDNGFGKFIYSDGDVYEGQFSGSYRHGFGRYEYIEGDIYEGEWNWSDREGLGFYQWPSGNKYIGYWSDNQQDGLGTKYYTNGTTEAGNWSKGVFQTDDKGFGFASQDTEATQSGEENTNGLFFKRSTDGKILLPKHNQIPMKQNGFQGGIPTNGLGSPMEDPYYNMANTVVSDILRGLGKTDISNPQVKIINSDRDVAYTSKNGGIHVSTKLIDLCRSFGKDSLSALSVVLAHELGHYFKDHFFCRDFGYAYGETEWGQDVAESFDEIFETGYFETQADEFGLFFSFVSGYEPFEVAAEVLEMVYEEFDLPEELKGYPSKTARMEQVELARENVEKLIPLFEVGNFMSLLGSLEIAASNGSILKNASLCYEHIIDQKITTSELYNNLGVNYINMALAEIEVEEFGFALPTELDFNSRLYAVLETGSGKGWGDDGDDWGDVLDYANSELVQSYLDQAIAYFDEAIMVGEDYIPAYNNLATAYILIEEYDEAWVKARKARKLAKEYDHKIAYRNSLDVLAIIAFFNDEIDDANEYWDEAISMDSRIARHNQLVHQDFGILTDGASVDAQTHASETFDASVFKRPEYSDLEKVNGQSLFDIGQEFIYDGKPMDTWQLKDQKAMVGTTEYNGEEFFIFAEMDRNRILDSYFFYFVDGNSNQTTSLNINNGQSAAEVESAYGAPASVISSNTHDYWVFVSKNVIFKINRDQQVDGWILYDVNL